MSKIYVDEIHPKTTNGPVKILPGGQDAWPAFRVGKTSNQSVSSTGNTDITFPRTNDSHHYIQGGMSFDSSGVVLTVPIDGIYMFGFAVRADGIGSGYVVTHLVRNSEVGGSSELYVIEGTGLSTNYQTFSGSTNFKCDANDTLKVYIFSSGDSSYTVDNNSCFYGHLIAPL